MNVLRLRLSFTSPAFLGGADQSNQFRTPPIKAQLRQWWRVACSASQAHRVQPAELRARESKLFGTVNEADTRRSCVRVRLSTWQAGDLARAQWPSFSTVEHPEVRMGDRLRPVPVDLYLGFGPVELHGGRTGPRRGCAIGPGEQAELSIGVLGASRGARAEWPLLCHAIRLADAFGTLGGRSRNGWGSYRLEALDDTSAAALDAAAPVSDASLLHDWREALQLEWPHALGRDSRSALLWSTGPLPSWRDALKQLAQIRIGLRTSAAFVFPTARPQGEVHPRHWLAYPVTGHNVKDWDRHAARLPNSLRFKLRPASDGRVEALVFHMPCRPPQVPFRPEARTLQQVWTAAHAWLDGSPLLKRVEPAACFA